MNYTIRAEPIKLRVILFNKVIAVEFNKSRTEDDKEVMIGHCSCNNMAILNKMVFLDRLPDSTLKVQRPYFAFT